jgi:hypothetical protein
MLVIFILYTAPTVLPAQPKLRTYTSPNGRFQFKYSEVLVRCTEPDRDEGKRGGWYPDSCSGYIPVCDNGGNPDTNTLVCLAYPSGEFKDYPTFEAETFSVAVIETSLTKGQCFSEALDEATDKPGRPTSARINSVRFSRLLKNSKSL